MDTQQKDLSYFRLRLQELLNTRFPEKAFMEINCFFISLPGILS